ncbi:MAG: DNA helicase [Comamonadaceae bacterium PBBC1]|nr:MAG: DNA helicase [Comamonadaceae bacterium PBBC1]
MQFRISDTFTDSLSRLTADEQKAVKITAFDLQQNPANPGMQLHRIEKSKDKHFWSARVGSDLRLIVHKTDSSFLLCYADHHDKAYQWAERRKLQTHPTTGAAQWVEIRDRVVEAPAPVNVDTRVRGNDNTKSKPLLFATLTDEQLLAYGVPAEWLADVKLANEDSLLTLAEHLPAEAAEALLELATGGKPQPVSMGKVTDPFSHPDAQRRFRVMHGVAELEQALNYPWEKWTIFLHPSQQQWVMRDYAGPARVSGSAGTGKTIVALHRAVTLAREHPDARVWLTTFSDTLAHALQNKINCLISHQPRLAERLEVADMNAMGQRLMDRLTPKGQAKPRLATPAQVREAAAAALAEVKAESEGALLTRFNLNFVLGEWADVVDAWQLQSWDDYRDVKRLGRKTRLNEAQRQALWHVFTGIQSRLAAAGVVTHAAMFTQLAHQLAALKHPPFDYVVVDEAQDVSISQLRMLAAMAGVAPDGSGSVRRNSLFFAGDLGQRIFQQPFSWKSLGVDVRGRSRTLHINYRTSHQIRQQADRLLGPEVSDSDGNTESRKGTVSVFNGPAPLICSYKDEAAEIAAVADWLKGLTAAGYAPHEVGVFVRSEAQLDRAIAALQSANMPMQVLDEHVETSNGQASVCTMHLAKGLEFRAVVVMACDDEVIPLQSRIESVMDESDLLDVYDTERHLLYVACTRARDSLLVSSVSPASEFVDDLG